MERLPTRGKGWGRFLAGALLGAAVIYFSDKKNGRRRRALLRDKLYSMRVSAGHARDAATHDFGNRVHGVRARLRRALSGRQPVDEPVLTARLHTQLGRLVSHPHAISVTADGGHMVLSGAILADERENLLTQARKIPGVTEVEDRLTVYATAIGVPALQGRPRSAGRNTSQPALKALAGAGSVLGAYGLARKSPAGLLLAGAGLALLGRAIDGLRQGGRQKTEDAAAIHLEKSIEVHAAPETVFDIWSDFENFPHFFSMLLAVQDLGDERSRWVAQETETSRLEWNAVWSKRERPRMLAWHSEEASAFGHAGSVMLEPTRNGTRVTLQLHLQPGFSIDPARELEEDLIRMKSFIESGVVPHHHAAQPPLQEGGPLLH